ncbi:MAG: glycerol-3-phosphate 1-O-acyltransferase PlsY [Planctomycetota bacterium]|nr:glycerol-3-phosphate 1-O-acyltransferase PlsY [Planctomycetota bacterium]RLS24398.1 MAG: glycerol-3-phosphate 1-O-acyltransferase [Planctomycetota bacterium]
MIPPSIRIILPIIGTYLIGSIPFGLLVARFVGGIDIRQHGSGNIGATNVGRTLGRKYFFVVFILDMLKGFLPTFFAVQQLATVKISDLTPLVSHAPILVAAAAVIGHNFPAYLKFKGGKGVATSLGVVLAIDVNSSLLALAVFIFTLSIWRFISLSSLLATSAFLVGHFSTTEKPFGRLEWGTSVIMTALWAMMIWRHRTNLKRIMAGTEPKIGQKKS